jgi:diguanylate cyclase (GGDEF)-like protein/PAS domain S-box-containing protein
MNTFESEATARLLNELIARLDDGITVSDENGHFEIFNLKMEELTGYTMKEANSVSDFAVLLYPDPLEHRKALEQLKEVSGKFVYYKTETSIKAKDGLRKTLFVSTSLLDYKEQKMFLSIYRDITSGKATEKALIKSKEKLEMQAWGLLKANEGIKILYAERDNLLKSLKELTLKDEHTDLYNYRYLTQRLAVEVERAHRHVFPLSVLMIDIDYFKVFNDVYGHPYGDRILKEFAGCLKDLVRNVDIVTRYGGEEFVIVMPDTNKEGAMRFGQRLLDVIGKHIFDHEDKKVRLKISIGLASLPEDGADTKTAAGLINLADKALLNAKETGRNKLCTVKDIAQDSEVIVGQDEKVNVNELKEKLSQMADRIDNSLFEAIQVFAKTIKSKDHYTGEHAENMVAIVVKIGEKLNLPSESIKNLEQATLLHDLGNIGVPESILQKKEKLTLEENEIIKRHPKIGAELIRPIHFLDRLLPLLLYHHERFDGLGYSAGLKGKDIPLGARIISIVDVYQALISDRPYRKAYSQQEALDVIRAGSGSQFDPDIVDVFMQVIDPKNLDGGGL